MPKNLSRLFFALLVGWAAADSALATTWEVGPGKPFSKIQSANDLAQPGDVILVHPRPKGRAYPKTAVFVQTPSLTFLAVSGSEGERVNVSGDGFSYSGRGSIPRAIFQFGPEADGCVLDGFEIHGAHNLSHNGAGVRINQANHVTIRNCDIHHNDMGIQSGGDGSQQAAVAQQIEFCTLHHNGDPSHPGFSHNLYLGGTSVTLSGCEIHASQAGHNVKSRAHHTRIEYCYIHDSHEREIDLVDAVDTTHPQSHAVLLANIIAKDFKCQGNRGVIHFGQDGGHDHLGTVHLIHNTIVTPYITAIVNLSAPSAKAHLVGNLISDGGVKQAHQQIIACHHGASTQNVTGASNWFSGNFQGIRETQLEPSSNVFDRMTRQLFIAPAEGNYQLVKEIASDQRSHRPVMKISLPPTPGSQSTKVSPPMTWQYRHPASRERREAEAAPALGALGARDH